MGLSQGPQAPQHAVPKEEFPRRETQWKEGASCSPLPPCGQMALGQKVYVCGEGGRGLRKDQQVPLFPRRTECRFCACVFRDSLRTLDREMSLTCSCQKLVSAQTEQRAGGLRVTICSRSWARLGQRPSVRRGNPGRFGCKGETGPNGPVPDRCREWVSRERLACFCLRSEGIGGLWWGRGAGRGSSSLVSAQFCAAHPFFFPSVTLLLRRVKSNLNV